MPERKRFFFIEVFPKVRFSSDLLTKTLKTIFIVVFSTVRVALWSTISGIFMQRVSRLPQVHFWTFWFVTFFDDQEGFMICHIREAPQKITNFGTFSQIKPVIFLIFFLGGGLPLRSKGNFQRFHILNFSVTSWAQQNHLQVNQIFFTYSFLLFSNI